MLLKVYKYPVREKWLKLLERPVMETSSLEASVSNILREVKTNGDDAVKRFSSMFDKVSLDELIVSQDEIEQAVDLVDEELKTAIKHAKANLEKFHQAQTKSEEPVVVQPGVTCWRKSIGIEKVGL